MNICLLSPYHGGSHKAWAQGYREHSRHRIRLLTLPPRFWKWRMHGGAITLARTFLENAESPDLILSTDMLDLSLFLGSTRRQEPSLTERTEDNSRAATKVPCSPGRD